MELGQILLIDDEEAVLDGLTRRLEDEFEVTCCNSGEAALELLQANQQYSAVVTDMRMPVMDGLEFIKQARAIAPNSIYMMLTGNQDLQTARDAVNEGRVFRYLTKPCSGEELLSAINAATEQFERAAAKNEIVISALSGSVKVMDDILKSGDFRLSVLANRLNTLWKAICERLNWQSNSDTFLTGRLCLTGVTTLSESATHALIDPGMELDAETLSAFKKMVKGTTKLIGRLPKLRHVEKVLQNMGEVDGQFEDAKFVAGDEEVPLSAHNTSTMLSTLVVYLVCLRKSGKIEASEIELFLPHFDPEAIAFLQSIDEQQTPDSSYSEKYPMHQLITGMVFAEDVFDNFGKRIFCRNDLVTQRLYDEISRIPGLPAEASVTFC